MRVKLFSHGADPDGLGSVVLASLVYKNFDYTLCKNNSELDQVLESFIDKQEYSNFDKVFITDLCPSNDILDKIESIKEFASKCLVFDHHKTTKENLKKEYTFVTVEEEMEGQKVCGTSLFYNYLSSYLETSYIKGFVEHTRLHDTWEWKKEGNLNAFHLETLFQYLGCYGYFYHFLNNCNQKTTEFEFDTQENEWILCQQEQNKKALENLVEHLRIKKEENTTYGCVIGAYEYRNSFSERLKEDFPDLDICILLAYDNGTVSFRSLKEIPVDVLACQYGGHGHAKAASCKLTPETELKLIKRFLI